jgi:hypothetical protein
MNADGTPRSLERSGLGALMLIALGSTLFAHNVLPAEQHEGPFHAALLLASFAAAFGALYAFTDVGRRWFRLGAIFLGTLAAVALFASGPWSMWNIGFGMPLWPVGLIVLGLLIARRERLGAAGHS